MPGFEYLDKTGVILPDTADLLAAVQAEYRAVFGDDLSVDSETPQGTLIASETQARADVLRMLAELANQVNPDVSGGRFLDSLCALLGLERNAATRTFVPSVIVTGQPQTVVRAGTRARTEAGFIFQSVNSVQLDNLGAGVVDFAAVDLGATPCPANTLTTIVDAVLGLETITNTTAGVVGTDEQSDESLRSLRRATLARQGISVSEAITSALYDPAVGVRSLQFRENVTNAAAVIDGINLVAHSVWVCAHGGADADVALALLSNKTAGADWNGAVTVDVVDEYSGQTYAVAFDRASPVPFLVRITARRGSYTGNVADAVRNSVMDYVDGEIPGERGFVVGGGVSPFEISGAVTSQTPGVYVSNVEILRPSEPGGGSWRAEEYQVSLNEVPTLQASSITVIEL
jgi:uncharacterized phage protein gp47/JayE